MSSPLLRRLACLLPVVVALFSPSAAALSEEGRPLLRRFSPKDYQSHYQVWCAAQASDGRMWFGSLNGAIVFDGHTWTKAPVPTSWVRQLVEGPGGRMFVGGEDVLGYIEADRLGGWRYVSLLDRVPAEAKPLGLGRRVVRLGDDIFVGTDRSVCRIRGDEVRVWPFDPAIRNVVDVVGDQLYLLRGKEGIFRLRGDTFEHWATPAPMERSQYTFLLPADGAAAVLGLGQDGLFRLDASGQATPWGGAARELAGDAQFFAGRRLRDGSYALATINAGAILLSPDGTEVRQIAEADGLTSNIVIGFGEDREGGLWAATQNGITRIDRVTPATVFDDSNGLGEAITQALLRHRGVLHTLFDNRVLRLVGSERPGRAHWEPVAALPPTQKYNAIASHAEGLLLGSAGVQVLADDRVTPIVESATNVTSFAVSVTDPARVFVGWDHAVTSIRFADGAWRDEGAIPGIEGEPYSMIETSDGTLWVATGSRGVFRARRTNRAATWAQADVKNFHESNGGLPAGHGWVFVEQTPFGPRFSTEIGPFKYDAPTDRLLADTALIAAGGKFPLFEAFVRATEGDTWALNASNRLQPERPLVRIHQTASGGFEVTDAPAAIASLLGMSGLQVSVLEPGPHGGGVLWARGLDKLVRIDLARLQPRNDAAAPVLASFSAEGSPRSLPTPDSVSNLHYSTEPVVFRFAAARFGSGSTPRFQTRLVGFRENWSEPSADTATVFTNLEGGPFRFEVRTVDGDGHTSPPAALAFSVAPPWHRSPAAYAGYGVLLLGAFAGFVRWRVAQSERERLRLEGVVAERTTQLKIAKDAADEANRAKSTFLANMSHELRTPLNGVIGYAQVLQKSSHIVPQDRERLRIVQTSGEHLLRMINEVLDFSKIEAGKLELRPAPFNLPQLLRDIASAFEARAAEKQLEFLLETTGDLPATVIGDAQKLRQVLDNLLSNAVKFTATGTVALRVTPLAHGGRGPSTASAATRGAGTAPPAQIHFAVEDTGSGISTKDQGALFQPFHQPVDGRPPEPGTGLGLAIAKRLAELMGGTLEFESTPGVGSTFSFSIPLEELNTDTPAAELVTRSPIGYHGERRRLLVVDDVAINRAVLVDLLAPLGFELREAASGADALSLVKEFPPHLIFLDLRMPGMDGLELARRLREAPFAGPRPVLIAMSASVLSFNRDNALEAGCDDFLPKPFREAELVAKLGMHLGLTWTYPEAPTAKTAGSFRSPISAADLGALLILARRGEIRALREQLASLRARYPADARIAELEALAGDYRMEAIRTQLAAYTDAAGGRSRPPDSA